MYGLFINIWKPAAYRAFGLVAPVPSRLLVKMSSGIPIIVRSRPSIFSTDDTDLSSELYNVYIAE